MFATYCSGWVWVGCVLVWFELARLAGLFCGWVSCCRTDGDLLVLGLVCCVFGFVVLIRWVWFGWLRCGNDLLVALVVGVRFLWVVDLLSVFGCLRLGVCGRVSWWGGVGRLAVLVYGFLWCLGVCGFSYLIVVG